MAKNTGAPRYLASHYLTNVEQQLRRLKELGEKAFGQLSDEARFHAVLDEESNSIAVLIRHLSGNMISRWTDFLTTDGEKANRQRDTEFARDVEMTPDQLREAWNKGWECLFEALAAIAPADLQKSISIRGVEHSVLEAIQRSLVHYSEHVGQIVFLAKHLEAKEWKPLSIPRGQSERFFRPK